VLVLLFFFTATSATALYTLSLHDALPILVEPFASVEDAKDVFVITSFEGQGIMIGEDLEQQDAPLDEQETDSDSGAVSAAESSRSEEHTSELQSRFDLVCRLLLEKKNIKK